MAEKTLTLIEVQTGVRKLTQFEKTKEDLEKMVAVSSKITVPDITNAKQVALAKTKRIELRKVEIDIEKQGKGYRDVFNSVNKEISAKEKELKGITTPEINRLAEIETEAEDLKLKIQREALLPVRKERLLAIDPKGCYICADEYLLEMDAVGFEAYLNHCSANKNKRDQVEAVEAMDRKREAEENKIAEDRAKLEAEKQQIEDEKAETEEARLAKEKEDYEIEQKSRAGLLPERRKSLEAIGDTVPELADNIMLAMDDNEYTTYYNNRVTAKNEADTQAIGDKRIADEEEVIESKKHTYRQLMQTFATVNQCDKHKHDNEWGSPFELDIWQERRDELAKKEKKEKEEKSKLEKQEKYKAFLKEHGWTPATRDQFETREIAGGYELWQKVGVFKN